MEPGKLLGHFELAERLGRGGMGEVYRARDTQLGREVALKVLAPHLAQDAAYVARLDREARLLAALNHPAIATLHSFGEHDGTRFIVMELVPGDPLDVRLRDGPLPVRQTLAIARQVADALEAAHARGIVHRDLKPSNVMLDDSGRVRVLDFGIARKERTASNDVSTLLTSAGGLVGTAAYMSPEQARGETVDRRSDIWSFGCLVFEIVTGQSPFRGETDAVTLANVLTGDPDWTLVPTVPAELGSVLRKCLAKAADERPSRIAEVRDPLVRSALVAEESDKAIVSRGDVRGAWRAAISVGLTVTAVAAGVLLLRAWSGEEDRAPVRFGQTEQITSRPGLELDPALSPDGRVVAYAAGPIGDMDLFIRQVAGGNAINLTDGFEGHHRWPQWSPDGNRLMFVTVIDGVSTVSVVPAFGGSPRYLLDLDETRGTFSSGVPGIALGSPAWSPDGTSIAYSQADAIFLQPLEGSEPRLLAEAYDPHSLSWSPDSRLLGFVSGNSEYVFGTATFANAAPTAILSVRIADGEVMELASTRSMNVSPVWASDGRSLFFVSNRDGSRDVYRLPLSSSGEPIAEVERLTTGLDAHTISLARDGSAIAYSALQRSANVWSIPVPDAGPVDASGAVAVTSGSQTVEGIAISRDGRLLAYDSDVGGDYDVYTTPAGGGGVRRITTHPADDFAPSWSPDGERLTFHSFRNDSRDVYVIGADGRNLEQVTRGPHQDRYQDWAPDGGRIVFHSDRAGRQALFIVSRNEEGVWGDPVQLTDEVASHPRWSPDGTLIAYTGVADRSLSIVSSEGGESVALVVAGPSDPVPGFVAWSPDSRTVYYKAVDDLSQSSIWGVPATGGAPRMLVVFDDPARASPRPDFATDGARFFFTVGRNESDIWLMEVEESAGAATWN